jgi:hypothetical protein
VSYETSIRYHSASAGLALAAKYWALGLCSSYSGHPSRWVLAVLVQYMFDVLVVGSLSHARCRCHLGQVARTDASIAPKYSIRSRFSAGICSHAQRASYIVVRWLWNQSATGAQDHAWQSSTGPWSSKPKRSWSAGRREAARPWNPASTLHTIWLGRDVIRRGKKITQSVSTL